MLDFLRKKKQGEKIVLRLDGMHCSSCSLNVDSALEEIDGVYESSTSYAKQQTVAYIDSRKVTLQKIKSAITQLGYTVQ